MSVQFPNVPDSPGVPPVLRILDNVQDVAATIYVDAMTIVQMFAGQQWGLFQSGTPVFPHASVIEVEVKKGYRLATHPIEQGGFMTYNKVEEPFEAKLQIACDGSSMLTTTLTGPGAAAANRQAFVRQIQSICGSLDLYDLHMPEMIQGSLNVTHYEIAHKTQGAVSMVVASINLEEVRIAAPMAFAPTPAAPDGASPQSGGAPQPATPTAAQTPPPISAGGTMLQ